MIDKASQAEFEQMAYIGHFLLTHIRFVTVIVGERRVALAVDSVLGVREVPAGSLQQLPPLLQEIGAEVVAGIGLLDAELLLVLSSTRLLPDESWAGSAAPGSAA